MEQEEATSASSQTDPRGFMYTPAQPPSSFCCHLLAPALLLTTLQPAGALPEPPPHLQPLPSSSGNSVSIYFPQPSEIDSCPSTPPSPLPAYYLLVILPMVPYC